MIDPTETERALRAARSPRFVSSPADLETLRSAWEDARVLGVDTEFLRERTYRAELGLVQVSDGRRAWLIDPVALDTLTPLTDMLCNPDIVKVMHSASEDLEVLWHRFSVSPEPLVDTQIAVALMGQPLQCSYHHTVKWLCDIEVDKEQTRSNWLKRPLRPEQLHYAATDVVFLPLIYRELRERLEVRDRWEWVLSDTDLLRDQARRAPEPETAYLRIRGAGRLRNDALRALRNLARWREETAIERNIARGFIASDAVLLQIASALPETTESLSDINDLHPKRMRRYGTDIIQAVRDARESDEPVAPLRTLDSRQKAALDRMRQIVKDCSEELGVDPALLASRRILEELIHANSGAESLPDRLTGWRYDLITRHLLEAA